MTGQALEGISVIETASYVTGPYAAMLLADAGAEVVKIESKPDGDPFRSWGEGSLSPTFSSMNRNKKSLTLDLTKKEGRDVFLDLARSADVIVQNYRPGVVERLGIGYETVRDINPRIVYCSISGFGEDGPYRDRPGYDTIGQAMSGLLSLLTDLEAPKGMGFSISDHITGVFACYGILLALLARERTGKGQHVQTSLLQATFSFISESAARYFGTGDIPRRQSRVRLAQVYALVAGDGRPFVIHLSSPPKFWEGLTAAIGRPDLRDDPRFKNKQGRAKHYDELSATLADIVSQGSRDWWLERLQEQDVPCCPLNTLEEVIRDPQVQHLGLVGEVEHSRVGRIRLAKGPVRLSDSPTQLVSPPPLLGEHTDEVLRGLGYGDERIDQLRREDVI